MITALSLYNDGTLSEEDTIRLISWLMRQGLLWAMPHGDRIQQHAKHLMFTRAISLDGRILTNL